MSHRGRVEPRRTVQGLHVNFLHRNYIYSILFPFFTPIRFPFVDSNLVCDNLVSTNTYGEAQFKPSTFDKYNIYIYICIVEKTIESFEALDKRGEHIGNKSLEGLYHAAQ